MSDDITVTRNDDRSRYEVHVGGELGGYMMLKPAGDGVVVIPHTQLDPAFKGRGLGSALASGALADLARRGETVVPTCPFIAHYLHEHDVPGLRVDWPAEDEPAEAGAAPA